MARSSRAIPAAIAAQPGRAKALSKPHPLRAAVMATAMAAPGAKTRTRATSTSRRPRLCGQRASRPNDLLRRGASASHSATAPNTARNIANLIAPSNSVMVYSSDHLNTRTSSHAMSTNAKRDIFANLARIGTALSSPTRIEFLELLAQTERSVEQLATLTGATVANTSQHLQKLRQAGLITGRKEGLYVFYRLAGDEVVGLLSAIGHVGETYLAEVERIVRLYLAQKDNLEPVPARELLARARRGAVTVLDVRPPEEYAAGHLPGALNLPLPQLAKQLHKLPANREIVAYCRGPYCLLSYDAVEMLRAKGRKARRLAEGYPEWQSAGLPVDRSDPESAR